MIESEPPGHLARDSNRSADYLAKMCCGDPSIYVHKDSRGKPLLSDPNFHISISHSGSSMLVAIGTVNLGVDVEFLRRPHKWRSVYRWINREEDTLEAPSESDFLACWTAKESLLKAIGEGLDYGMQRLSVPHRRSPGYRGVHVAGQYLWIRHLPCWKKMTACLAVDEPCAIQTYYLTGLY